MEPGRVAFKMMKTISLWGKRAMEPHHLRRLYATDPQRADALIFGRRSDPITRRGFLAGAGLAAMTAALGARPAYAQNMPAGLLPAMLMQEGAGIEGKHPGLRLLNDRPINAETPAHLLDDTWTPADRLFIRNNGHPPPNIDADTWTVRFSGESCAQPVSFTINQLKEEFEEVTLALTLECGGNGRHEFYPPARGNQWTTGAVGCPLWTGVRLRDVLKRVGVNDDAVYVAYNGADIHLSGQSDKRPISRGVTLAKAMEAESLIAWAVDNQPLPLQNGFPLRLVFGGWPGSCSGKWLNEIMIRDRVHDGMKMTGSSYRVPCDPVPPGTKVADDDMCIIHAMPVKSLITKPTNATSHGLSAPLTVRGHAWAGDRAVRRVDLSIDYGATWTPTTLAKPRNRNAWQRFESQVRFPKQGYYEVWARAMDDQGVSQPMVVPGWNPKGYLNNACHRIGVKVDA